MTGKKRIFPPLPRISVVVDKKEQIVVVRLPRSVSKFALDPADVDKLIAVLRRKKDEIV